MIRNQTYHNFIIIMNRLIKKGYNKEEAEKLTRNCFDNAVDGRSPEIFESMILSKADYEKKYKEVLYYEKFIN